MRIFEITSDEDIEALQDGRVVGVYVPGQRYTCHDDERHQWLSNQLDQWLEEGKAVVVEEREGTRPASVGGEGEVK